MASPHNFIESTNIYAEVHAYPPVPVDEEIIWLFEPLFVEPPADQWASVPIEGEYISVPFTQTEIVAIWAVRQAMHELRQAGALHESAAREFSRANDLFLENVADLKDRASSVVAIMANAYKAYDTVRMYEFSCWAPDERQTQLFGLIRDLPSYLTAHEGVHDRSVLAEDDEPDDTAPLPLPPPDWRPWNNS